MIQASFAVADRREIDDLGAGVEWVERTTRESLLPDAASEAGGILALPWDKTGGRLRRAGTQIKLIVPVVRYDAWRRAAGGLPVDTWLAGLADSASGLSGGS